MRLPPVFGCRGLLRAENAKTPRIGTASRLKTAPGAPDISGSGDRMRLRRMAGRATERTEDHGPEADEYYTERPALV